MTRLFGTDGVRGVFGRELTLDLAQALGAATARVLRSDDGRPRIVIGRDTRASGPALEAAFCSGALSAGADVLLAGVEPTPAVAFLTASTGSDAGVVISASHNPPEYNGIKLFGRGGRKLPDAIEDSIEAAFGTDDDGVPTGSVLPFAEAEATYADHVIACAEARLDGMRVVVDCANGAASHVAPIALAALGAEVHAINDHPDGDNINLGCGALHPEVMAAEVLRLGADAGVAFDGDADRALFAGADGAVIDGDQVLAACALSMREAGVLAGDTVVTTVMANLGFRIAMREAGIGVLETAVGDRYVLEAMVAAGANLGGEQSGHVIFLDQSPTGDGLLTATRFLSLAARRGVGLARLAAAMARLPQVLVNVPVSDRSALDGAAEVWDAVRVAERELGSDGRVLVRASGTEDLVRVMVEAITAEAAEHHATSLAGVVARVLG